MVFTDGTISKEEKEKFKQDWTNVCNKLKDIYEHADERNAKYYENIKREKERNISETSFS